MSNTYKIIIAAISVTVLGATSIFLVGQNREQTKPATSSSSASVISSVKSQIVYNSSSSQSQTKASSSLLLPVSSNVKTESQQTQIPQPIQDIPNVTKLSTDTSIYHQYIKDYLACPTKFYQTLNGGYIYEGLDQYKYKCIPKEEADKCPSKSLIYGLKPLIGKEKAVVDGTGLPPGMLKEIKADKYYCAHFYETTGSVSMGEVSGYGWIYLPDNGLDPKLSNYFVIPKTNLSLASEFDQAKTTFAAIPLSSFSQADQEYISKNFKIK